MTRPVVLVESPYSGQGLEAVRYLFCCLLDSILRGEAPIASHALYPLALPEHCGDFAGKTGREIGLECRDALAELRAEWFGFDTERHYYPRIKCVRYIDLGSPTSGMQRPGNYGPDRHLQGEAARIWEANEWPSLTRWARTNESEAAE